MVPVHLSIVIVATIFVWRYRAPLHVHLPMICIVAAIGLLHGLVPAITPSALWSIDASSESRETAALFALAGLIALCWGYRFHFSRHQRRPRPDRGYIDWVQTSTGQALLRRFYWVSILLGVLGAYLYVQSAGVGLAHFASAARFEFRLDKNLPLASAGVYLFHFAFAPGFLGFFLPRSYRLAGICFATVLTALSFFVLFKGTRHIALGIPSGVLFGYIFSHRLTPIRLFGIACAGCVLVAGTVSLYEVRKELNSVPFTSAVARAFSAESLAEPLSRDPLNYHEHFVGAVEYFPSDHPYLNGATYRRMLTFYLPGANYPTLKPDHPARVVANVVYGKKFSPELCATVPPSLLGDAYVNFWGWPGLGVLFLNGMAVSWISAKVRESVTWFLAIGPHMGWFVILAPREGPYDYFVMGLLLLIMTSLIAKFLPRPQRRRQSQPIRTLAPSQAHLPARPRRESNGVCWNS